MVKYERKIAYLVVTTIICLFSDVVHAVEGDVIILEDFENPKFTWYAKNDPVMGGRSTSNVTVGDDGLGKLNGEVVNVPFLSAPGFITMETRDVFPDISMCEGLEFEGRATTPYSGYRLSFGMAHAKNMRYGRGYKAPFEIGTTMDKVTLSFSKFSDNWDEATGDILVECSNDNPTFCPKTEDLMNLGVLTFWGEGVNGVVDLELKSISAYDCVSDNDGDLFKSLIRVFSSPAEDKDLSESDQSDTQGTIGIALGGAALVISLIALASVFKMKKTSTEPKPVLKASDPDDQLL